MSATAAVAAVDLAISFIQAGLRLQQLVQKAQAENREVTWEDVDALVAESNSARAEFEANRQGG